MNVTVDFPAEEVGRFAKFVFDDQLPFVESRALNETAKAFQKHQRAHLRDIFTIRRDSFADRSIKISPFATKTDPEVRIAVDSPAGRSDVFGKFEDETFKDPLGNSVAVPTEHVPRTGSGIIKKAWKPRRVLERNFRDGFRAFIRETGGKRAIFFDEGDKIVPLYWLKPRVPIKPELHFVDNAHEVVEREWVGQFSRAFDLATATAR